MRRSLIATALAVTVGTLPYVKYSVPLGKGSKTALVLSSEPFFNLNTTRFQGRTGLDRVPNLIAINTPVTTKVTAEFNL